MDSQQTPDHDPAVTPPTPPANGAPDPPIDDAQLSAGAWLRQHGPTLAVVGAVLALIGWKMGLEGLWTIAKVALGLGAVIFIHELGHFLVAKWCDVHVQTFSIGFGPALPGCIYKWGETTYKIALFPLGGYVKMVGEGGDNDEEDADPRSYKNKGVGQRMAIISAGVVMNILFGLVAFIVAFKIGVHWHAPVVGVVEAGGPAWVKGVRTGDEILKVDDVSHPYFEDMKIVVMLSDEGEQIPFRFRTPGGEPRDVSIAPRKAKNEPNPVIGIRWGIELRLPDKRGADPQAGPVLRNSAAAAARALDLKPDDQLVAATDPDNPDAEGLKELPAGEKGYAELAERLGRLVGRPVKLRFRRAGSEMEGTMPPGSGFQFEDAIVGTTDPGADNPFQTAPLEIDPRDPQGRHLDYFEFLKRMNRLAGRPAVIQVRRKGAAESDTVNVFVPPAYHRVIPGVRMEMGAVTKLREGSSAEAQGVKERDVITGVTLTDGKGEGVSFAANPDAAKGEKQLDPLRLLFNLRAWAKDRKGVTAALKVLRVKDHDERAPEEVHGLAWDDSWRYDEERPLGVNASQSIPELGIAYQVKAQVANVERDSDAEKKGLQAGDFVLAWSYQRPPKKPGQSEEWPDKPSDLRPKDNPTGDPDPRWAGVFYQMQPIDYPKVKLLVRHVGGEEKEIELDLPRDEGWPLCDPAEPRGLPLFGVQDRIAIADSMGEAVQMGMRYTWRTIIQIYMTVKSLATRRLSATESLQGPIDIAVIAYATAGGEWADFILLLGLISVNLAVVNFLPIPILDGGHMVFLIYEKLRGRPASEHIRMAANWVGLLLLVSLMAFVLYLGVVRWIWPLITSWIGPLITS